MPGQSKRTRVAPGLYVKAGRFSVGYTSPEDGKWRMVNLRGARNVTEAKREQTQFLAKLGKGEVVSPTRKTVAEVASEWLEQLSGVKPRTRKTYEDQLRLYVLPILGRRRVQDVKPQDIVSLSNRLRDSRGLSPASVALSLAVVSGTFAYGVWAGYVPHNPVKQIPRGKRPKIVKTEKRILAPDELEALLGELRETLYHAPSYVAAWTGLREGEVLGLVWADLDLKASQLHVRAQLSRDGGRVPTKTGETRIVDLDPETVAFLRSHREARFSLGLAGAEQFVFATADGRPLIHRSLSRAFLKAAARAGLNGSPPLTFHSLRHRYASVLIAGGVEAPYVARQLGHSVPMLLTTYAHLFDSRSQGEKAMGALRAARLS